MTESARLKLTTAYSILEEVTDKLEPFQRAVAQSKSAWDAGFTKGLEFITELGRHTKELHSRVDDVLELAKESSAESDVSITMTRDGHELEITPNTVIATAHLARGTLYAIKENWSMARESLNESLSIIPSPDARLRLASVAVAEGDSDAARDHFQSIIDSYPDSSEAVDAMRALRDLEDIPVKSWEVAVTLSLLLGWAGADRFYLGYIGSGVVKLLTFGGAYVWWIIDIFLISTRKIRDVNGMKMKKKVERRDG